MSEQEVIPRVCIYARVPTVEQTGETAIAAQVKLCDDFAEEQKWLVVSTQQDIAYPGMTESRPALQRVFEGIEKGKFDILLVHSFDRLSLDPQYFQAIKRRAETEGVVIRSVTEPHQP